MCNIPPMSFYRNLKKLVHLPDWLNWLLSVVEPCIILIIALVLAYAGYWLIFGVEKSAEHQTRLTQLVELINDNWKAALILLVLLFYRTIRIFLEQTEEAFGMKRKKPISGEPTEEPNPTERSH